MIFKFEKDSLIKALKTHEDATRNATKSFEQMEWVMDELYKSLRWYQKMWIKIAYYYEGIKHRR